MRRRGLTRLSIAVLAISLVAGAGLPAKADAAADLRLCGKVTAYVPATTLTAGVLVIGPVPFVVAAGTTLSSQVALGADLCFALGLNASGKITDASVRANATANLNICGVVTAYAKADADSTGSLIIGGRKLVLAIGASLPTSVKVGADLCIRLTLNAFGQVQGGSARINVASTVHACGVVTALARATSTAAGSLAVGGRWFVLAAGSRLPALVAVGTDLCLTLTLNLLGQVQGANAVLNVESALEACGKVTAFLAATDTSNGRLSFAGLDRPVAAGTHLSSQIKVGAHLRLRLALDVFGRIADATVLAAGASLSDTCAAARNAATSASPDPGSEEQPGASASPDPGSGAQHGASGSGSPSPSAGVLGVHATNADCADAAANPEGRAAGGGGGGIVPDTASLLRTGLALVATSVPLVLLIVGLGGWLLYQRRQVRGGDGVAS
jgi:hypothetical protein